MSVNMDTPAMRQFSRFREEHPGCVLFFRMGDFYELFFEDAVLAHETLGVTLTQRTAGQPMAGVPHHAVEGYLRRMVQAGHRVAICDQIQDPKEAKGVVERAVTRVITPGTLTDEGLLDEGARNTLVAVIRLAGPDGDLAALGWAELSTGELGFGQCEAATLGDELARLQPSEILWPEVGQEEQDEGVQDWLGLAAPGVARTARPGWQARADEGERLLKRQLQVTDLSAFELTGEDAQGALAALGLVLGYLLETQKVGADGRLAHLQAPKRRGRTDALGLDAATVRSLELVQTLRGGTGDGALIGVFKGRHGPTTAMGKRKLREWLCWPLAALAPIEARHAVVAAWTADEVRRERIRQVLRQVQDVERMGARLAVGRVSPRDLVGLGRSAGLLEVLLEVLQEGQEAWPWVARLEALRAALAPFGAEVARCCVEDAPAHLRDGGLLRDGVDPELDEARALQQDSHAWLASYQAQVARELGLNNLKVGYNKVFGYFIELTKVNADKAPAHWHRKQTLTSGERYISEELKAFESKVLTAGDRAQAREDALFQGLCQQALGVLPSLQQFAVVVAEVDVLAGFAAKAQAAGWCRPEMVAQAGVLELSQCRHPVIEERLADRFVPNDVALGTPAQGARLALITGPNMAGKSTYIRQAALAVVLAHAGCFVPASKARIGLADRVMARVGANDELHAGRSTFMVEMAETAHICHHATARSVVVLDEIGRGTSTLDGLSLAWAIAEHMATTGCCCLFATHYHEITQLGTSDARVCNLSVAVREWQEQIVFLHQIVPGATDRSYGLHVAKIAGVPNGVLARAAVLLERLTVSHAAPAATTALSIPAERQETGSAARPAAAAVERRGKRRLAQASLFGTDLEHPAVERLRGVQLESLSPLACFDLVRELQGLVKSDWQV